MRRAAAVSLTLALVAVSLPLTPASAAPTMPANIEFPRWAVGFHWTYHYEGPTDQSFAGYHASYMNDTYTAEVIGVANTSRGDAWVIRNAHAGTLQGDYAGFPITGSFTSLTYYHFRQSDYAILNFTQDLNITANVPISGTVTGSAHNESYADPPLAQIVYGSPANGAPWRVYSNITSVGWYRIATSPQINDSSWVLLDYNLSVGNTANVSVPAGVFASYNISGSGTANFNGTIYDISQQFFYAPRAMANSVDEAGYLLTSFYVNRPPSPSSLPPLVVDAGTSATLDLSAYFSDPEGDSYTLSCVPAAPLNCSVAPNGTLTVSADPGTNATLALELRTDDGLPGGNDSFFLVVISSGPGNPNQPPTLIGGTTLTTPEDTPYTFLVPSHIGDPDDSSINWSLELGANATLSAFAADYFVISTAPNFTGYAFFNVTAFDFAGNFASFAFTLAVIAVNDPPEVSSLTPLDILVHEDDLLELAVGVTDVEGDSVAARWDLDGTVVGNGTLLSLQITGFSPGLHNLTVTATDAPGATATLVFRVTILAGPVITSTSPPSPVSIVAGYRLTFTAAVVDPDSTFLDYTWTRNGSTFASGGDLGIVNLTFPTPGTYTVRLNVTDGSSWAAHVWTVVAEGAPSDLASIASPSEGAIFDTNSRVNLTAFIDSRLTNVTVNWTLNGDPLPAGTNVVTDALSADHYTAVMQVTGLFNGSLPYSADASVSFIVRTPIPPVNNTTDGNPPPPAPIPRTDLFLLELLLLAAAGGAVIYLYLRRRRTPPPPPEQPSP